MNKRIKELESQCWEARPYGPTWFNSKKFAELIVKECADVAKTLHYPHFGKEMEEYEMHFDMRFKKHFGPNDGKEE